jgi:HD-GYP domain-containing protein (c-di-GMP phosphodiesterase class II)
VKAIKVFMLRPGMRFDQPVYIEGENVLVPAEIPIKEKDIERLARWQIEEVYTDGREISGEPEPARRSAKEGAWLAPREEKLLRAYRSTVEKVEAIFQDIVDGTSVSHEPIDAVVVDTVELLRRSRQEMIQLILFGELLERKLALSAVNCMLLSAVIGTMMKLTSHRLLQLATAGLLHDVGMLQIDKSILGKQGKLSEAERGQMQTHAVLGYRIISKDLKYPDEVARTALEHHERWDGQGYPRQLAGEQIGAFSRVVTVADAYEAMVSERPYRSPMIGYTAMRSILGDNGKHFDPQVLKAFLEAMGIFPIGSIVQLNNSSIGMVSENHPEAPLRPKLNLLLDERGNRLEGREPLDLLARKSLFIVKAIDPKTIGEPASG